MTAAPEGPVIYLTYRDDVEVIQPGEADDVAAVREIFAEIRTFAFDKHRHGLRDAHAKSHGIVRGTLRIHGGLPDELRQGLFTQPQEQPVIVRYSTAPGDIVPDGIAAARGMAIKVLDVDGAKVYPSRRTRAPRTFCWSTIRQFLPAMCTPIVVISRSCSRRRNSQRGRSC